MKVAVYCSSAAELPAEVVAGAERIAQAIGACGGELVYGGVNAGLMHTVAEAAKSAGAKVTGVVPSVFKHRADPLCDELIEARDLNDRKGKMIEMADLFVVLPGGVGSIDEWISTLSHFMVCERADPNAGKPILVWNHQGVYDAQIAQLKATDESVYGRGRNASRSLVFASADELADALVSFRQ